MQNEKVPENPPAFPWQPSDSCGQPMHEGFSGMDLRDWFAGQALAGMDNSQMAQSGSVLAKAAAVSAYAYADAMLAARKRED